MEEEKWTFPEFTPAPASLLAGRGFPEGVPAIRQEWVAEVRAWYQPQVYGFLRRRGVSRTSAPPLLTALDDELALRRTAWRLGTTAERFHRRLAARLLDRLPAPDPSAPQPGADWTLCLRLERAYQFECRASAPGGTPPEAVHSSRHLAHVLAGGRAVIRHRMDRQGLAAVYDACESDLTGGTWLRPLSSAERLVMTPAEVVRHRMQIEAALTDLIREACALNPRPRDGADS